MWKMNENKGRCEDTVIGEAEIFISSCPYLTLLRKPQEALKLFEREFSQRRAKLEKGISTQFGS